MKSLESKRVKQVLENDRLGISSDCKEVLKRDIADTLSSYFSLKQLPDVKIEAGIKGFTLYITACGEAFKSFRIVNK